MGKNMKYLTAAVVPSVALSVPVLAESGGSGSGGGSAVISAMTSLASEMTSTGTALIPIALGVVGITLVVRYGIKVFKGVAKP
jgi:hypothetical protein